MKPTPLIDAEDASTYGGKAARLADSLRAGLPVPPGFALGTALVEAIADSNPEAVVTLEAEFETLGGPCAVRSSAIGEDSDAASFAGQHLTVLNVCSRCDLVPAVVRVYTSALTPGALAYRQKLGIGGKPRMAVVVQRLIQPDCAGVMFTRNPLNGSDERVIEAAWGLGEVVVAGLVVPDNYVLDANGGLLRANIGTKDIALRALSDSGTVEEEVPPELVEAPCLDDRKLAALHELANRCEARFGRGLDLEWGFSGHELFLLQCRAITRNA